MDITDLVLKYITNDDKLKSFYIGGNCLHLFYSHLHDDFTSQLYFTYNHEINIIECIWQLESFYDENDDEYFYYKLLVPYTEEEYFQYDTVQDNVMSFEVFKLLIEKINNFRDDFLQGN